MLAAGGDRMCLPAGGRTAGRGAGRRLRRLLLASLRRPPGAQAGGSGAVGFDRAALPARHKKIVRDFVPATATRVAGRPRRRAGRSQISHLRVGRQPCGSRLRGTDRSVRGQARNRRGRQGARAVGPGSRRLLRLAQNVGRVRHGEGKNRFRRDDAGRQRRPAASRRVRGAQAIVGARLYVSGSKLSWIRFAPRIFRSPGSDCRPCGPKNSMPRRSS